MAYTELDVLNYRRIGGGVYDAPHDPLVRAIESRHATPALVVEVLRRVERYDTNGWEGRARQQVREAAARSPHTDPELLAGWVTGGDIAAIYAAANPGLGAERVAHLWVTRGVPRVLLLGNPHLDRELFVRHWRDMPTAALLNPNAPQAVLVDGAKLYPEAALSNPAYPKHLLEQALDPARTFGAIEAVTAILNPQLTLDELRHHRQTWTEQLTSPDAFGVRRAREVLLLAAEGIDARLVIDDPWSVPAHRLSALDVVDPVADVVLAGGEPADAVTALLRARFGGTVKELLGCADSITS